MRFISQDHLSRSPAWPLSGLFDPAVNARASDPKTSKAAARSLDPRSQLARLATAFRDARHGLTASEAETATGVNWKRVSDLKASGLIEPTGETRINERTGREQDVLRWTGN